MATPVADPVADPVVNTGQVPDDKTLEKPKPRHTHFFDNLESDSNTSTMPEWFQNFTANLKKFLEDFIKGLLAGCLGGKRSRRRRKNQNENDLGNQGNTPKPITDVAEAEARLKALMKKEGRCSEEDNAEFIAILPHASGFKELNLLENKLLNEEKITHLINAAERSLRVLILNGADPNISTYLAVLSEDCQLTHLNISTVRDNCDVIIESVKRFKTLQGLNLAHGGFNDAHLSALKDSLHNLILLDLTNCPNLTGNGVADLIDANKSLGALFLSNSTNITAENHNKIAKALGPQLRILGLAGLANQAREALKSYLSPEGSLFEIVDENGQQKGVKVGITHLILQDWNIDNEQLSLIAENCPSLTFLNILESNVSLEHLFDLFSDNFKELTNIYLGKQTQELNESDQENLRKLAAIPLIKEMCLQGKTDDASKPYLLYQKKDSGETEFKKMQSNGQSVLLGIFSDVLMPYFKNPKKAS